MGQVCSLILPITTYMGEMRKCGIMSASRQAAGRQAGFLRKYTFGVSKGLWPLQIKGLTPEG